MISNRKSHVITDKLNDISIYLKKKDLYNLMTEIVSLTGKIAEQTKNENLILKLKRIKNMIYKIYCSDVSKSKIITELIDKINETNFSKKDSISLSIGNDYIITEKEDGKNLVKFKNGDVYEGQLRHNTYDGKGEYKYINGDKYIGEYKNNKKEGKGIYYYKEGEKYEGEFKNDKRDGRGIYYYQENSSCLKYEGDWKNGFKEGNGILFLKNGERYEGNFKNDSFEGRGIYFFKNGDIYEGEFKKDNFDGKGIIYYIDGSREMGNYENGISISTHIKIDKNGEIEVYEY